MLNNYSLNDYVNNSVRQQGMVEGAFESDRPEFEFCLCNVLGCCVTLGEFLKLSYFQLCQAFKNRIQPRKMARMALPYRVMRLKRIDLLWMLLKDSSEMFTHTKKNRMTGLNLRMRICNFFFLKRSHPY